MIEKVDEKIKPKRGGKRPGSGRKAGTPNRITIELKQLANEYTEEAIQVFVDVMRNPETPAAVKIAAADKLLDRGHGRPAQSVEIDEPGRMDPEFTKNLEKIFKERMEAARERQRQVCLERGIIKEGDDF